MVLDVGLGSVQAAVIPDPLRSRVWGAILFVNWGCGPIGALAGGFLAGSIGLRPTMWIAAIGGIAGVFWLLPSRMSEVRAVSDEGLPRRLARAGHPRPRRPAAARARRSTDPDCATAPGGASRDGRRRGSLPARTGAGVKT